MPDGSRSAGGGPAPVFGPFATFVALQFTPYHVLLVCVALYLYLYNRADSDAVDMLPR